jgi:hypothetical protein
MADDDLATRLRRVQVDIGHLERVEEYLAQVVPEVESAKAHADAAYDAVSGPGATGANTTDDALRGPGGTGSSAFGSSGIPVVVDLTRCLVATRDTVATNLTRLAAGHRHTAGGIARVAELYRTVEERNRVSGAEVGKLLTSG